MAAVRRQSKRNKKKRKSLLGRLRAVQWTKRRVAAMVAMLALVCVAAGAAVYAYKEYNKPQNDLEWSLYENRQTTRDTTTTVTIGGTVYQEKELTTILFMGVDERGDIDDISGVPGENGQADMLMLAAIDEESGTVRLLTIPRETMALVDEYDVDGDFYEQVEEQICLQYAYGTDPKSCAELEEMAVRRMLNNVSIDYYCAFSMKAITMIIKEVGSVTVEMSEDHWIPGHTYQAGKSYTLKGEEAYEFVHFRDTTHNATNLDRMSRQKDFMKALVPALKGKVKDDPKFAVTLYNKLSDVMTTDISIIDVPTLANIGMGIEFDLDAMTQLPGEDIHVGKYDQFHVDEAALQEILLDTFYEPYE